ncbi:hypothetical protein SDC9_130097 [bioreactor metagenome]|uniref:DUF4956 domain-containing protein n=1 Tax=bioreactor metagenome TaxID=1076179 RepID=A0A645D1D6_9ZZZZ|nr:DUF4956 domain-containing protein [Oscillospiraceae bacterium]
MLDLFFSSVLDNAEAVTSNINSKTFLLCTLCSVLLGAAIAFLFTIKNTYTKSFLITLALLPAIVQSVIMLVNGNLGTGVAVMGAFSLVKFRSAPGSAKEICLIFLAMAVGLATGTGYLGYAVAFTLILGVLYVIYTVSPLGEQKPGEKALRITIPEGLDYSGIFDDLFEKYTSSHVLESVKTSNMGSLFKLHYTVKLHSESEEKQFLDAIRCRNGNLEISCARPKTGNDEL